MAGASRSRNQASLLTDARCTGEDWTSVTSVGHRRKLQNRLNQRAKRRRKTEQQKAKGEDTGAVCKWIMYVDKHANNDQQHHVTSTNATSLNSGGLEMILRNKDKKRPHLCQLKSAEYGVLLQQLQDLVSRNFTRRLLDGELLVPVMQFNIIRAMSTNAACLGLTMELLREDINSPFNTTLPWAANGTNLPPSLQPTALQKQIVHHPWIDLCPVPSIRDAMLQRMDEYDDEELCHNLFTKSEGGDGNLVGMVVWGEAWDPASYEISSAILRKWPWFAHDCPDLIQSTNYWRAQREDKPLCISPNANDPT